MLLIIIFLLAKITEAQVLSFKLKAVNNGNEQISKIGSKMIYFMFVLSLRAAIKTTKPIKVSANFFDLTFSFYDIVLFRDIRNVLFSNLLS